MVEMEAAERRAGHSRRPGERYPRVPQDTRAVINPPIDTQIPPDASGLTREQAKRFAFPREHVILGPNVIIVLTI
jgi:hypothetical protein